MIRNTYTPTLSKKRRLYDEDYVYGEHEKEEKEMRNNQMKRKYRNRGQNLALGTAHNVQKYVQYFILQKIIMNPWLFDAKNRDHEEKMISILRTEISLSFSKETHHVTKKEYLRTMVKNKKRLMTHVIRKILTDHPVVSRFNELILRHTLDYPSIRPMYTTSYYLKAKKQYEGIYGKVYPIDQIDVNHYLAVIDIIKQQIIQNKMT
jgi:hypothetical protein